MNSVLGLLLYLEKEAELMHLVLSKQSDLCQTIKSGLKFPFP